MLSWWTRTEEGRGRSLPPYSSSVFTLVQPVNNQNAQEASAAQALFDAGIAANDVVFITEDIDSTQIGTKLREAPIGIVSEENNLTDIEFGTASNIVWDPAATDITIDDNSHYITSTFSTGTLTVFTAAESMAHISGTLSQDLQHLGSTSFVRQTH